MIPKACAPGKRRVWAVCRHGPQRARTRGGRQDAGLLEAGRDRDAKDAEGVTACGVSVLAMNVSAVTQAKAKPGLRRCIQDLDSVQRLIAFSSWSGATEITHQESGASPETLVWSTPCSLFAHRFECQIHVGDTHYYCSGVGYRISEHCLHLVTKRYIGKATFVPAVPMIVPRHRPS